MDVKDTLNFIHNLEKELAVDNWEYAKVKVWPLIRRKIEQQLFFVNEGHLKHSNANLLLRIMNNTKKLIRYMNTDKVDISNNADLMNIRQGGAVFCSTSSARRAIIEDKYYDVFCDPFIEMLNSADIPSLVLEREYEGEIKVPRFNKSKFINGNIMLHIFYNSYKVANYLLQGWNLPKSEKQELITRLSDVGLDANRILREIPYNVALIEIVSDYYSQILKQINPRIAFVVVYAGILSTPFVLACRRLNIPVVDIQHSVQFYADYADFLKVPQQGYELLPNYFWCWDEKEIIFKYVDNVDRSVHQVFYGGNLWLEKWKAKQNLPSWILDYDQKFLTKAQGKFNILFTLQPDVPMPQYMLKVIESSPTDWVWWIRPHPRMKLDKELKRNILNGVTGDNIIFEESTTIPLLCLLRNVNAHVTCFSSTVLEAKEFDVPSIVVDETGMAVFERLINEGVVSVGLTEEEIYKILMCIKNKVHMESKGNYARRRSLMDLLNLSIVN